MSSHVGHSNRVWAEDAHELREPRSGLSGFGGRPVLHPAWREPEEATVDLALLSATAANGRRAIGLPRHTLPRAA